MSGLFQHLKDKYELFRVQGADDLVDENDYLTYLNQGMYELRSGSAEVAIEYLDQAIRSDPEDEILFIMRCKCLIK